MDEYIEREATIRRIRGLATIIGFENPAVAIDSAVAVIERAPTSDVAPVRHGKWFPTAKWWQGGSAWKQCSECGIFHLGKSNFCPNCGAKMDLEG